MKKNLKEYVIVLSVIVLVGLLLIIIKNNILSLFNEVIDTEWQTGNDEEESIVDDNKLYIINYQGVGGLYIISMREHNDYINVKKETMYQCNNSSTECPKNFVNEYEINFDSVSMKKIKDLIISLNNRYSTNEIYESYLIREEQMVMRAITNNDVKFLNTNVNYEIFNNINPTFFEISGYKIKKYYNYSSIEIGMEQQPNSRYYLEIEEVIKSGNDIHIIVKENLSNNYNSNMIDVGYFTITVEIYDEYDNIIVRNTNNSYYTELNK